MLSSTLYRGEKVYSDENIQQFYRDHGLTREGGFSQVTVNGEKRLLAATGRPPGHDASGYSKLFSALMADIPESEYDARIDEQIELEARVSDFCDFPAFDQDGLPTCWAIGTCQSMSMDRRIQGLPHVQISGCSVAVPISGGHSGGWEGDAVEYLTKHGGASVAVWPENNTSRGLNSDPKVIEDRQQHLVMEFAEMQSRANWATACLKTKTGPFAYNRMSHVMAMADFVRTERGAYGFRVRNSWHDSWGAKNKHGFGGFAVYSWTPDSGYIINQVKASEK
ncbi:MAG: hypothetical protein ACREA9_23260 [Pyrinomonadaceae bacterium]